MDSPLSVTIFMSMVFYLLQFFIVFAVFGFALSLVGRGFRFIYFSFRSNSLY